MVSVEVSCFYRCFTQEEPSSHLIDHSKTAGPAFNFAKLRLITLWTRLLKASESSKLHRGDWSLLADPALKDF